MNAPFDQTIAKAEKHLTRFRQGTVAHFIDGKQDAGSGKTFETLSPVDNSAIAKVARGTADDIDRAAKAAKRAFQTWGKTSGAERKKVLHKIADAIVARADEIALVECMDTGQPIRYMSKAALRGAENFRFFADRAPDASNGLSLPTETHINYTMRQPIGPVGVITPWNTPFMLSTWKIAPALAAGLHGRAQAGRMEPPHRVAAYPKSHSKRACPRASSIRARVRRGRGPRAHRASGHQGDRLCRRVGDGQRHHGAGFGHAEARAFRTRRQEPGDRVRRCRSR
jgi:hypothetical protein